MSGSISRIIRVSSGVIGCHRKCWNFSKKFEFFITRAYLRSFNQSVVHLSLGYLRSYSDLIGFTKKYVPNTSTSSFHPRLFLLWARILSEWLEFIQDTFRIAWKDFWITLMPSELLGSRSEVFGYVRNYSGKLGLMNGHQKLKLQRDWVEILTEWWRIKPNDHDVVRMTPNWPFIFFKLRKAINYAERQNVSPPGTGRIVDVFSSVSR